MDLNQSSQQKGHETMVKKSVSFRPFTICFYAYKQIKKNYFLILHMNLCLYNSTVIKNWFLHYMNYLTKAHYMTLIK